jgi:hypothetical protein
MPFDFERMAYCEFEILVEAQRCLPRHGKYFSAEMSI